MRFLSKLWDFRLLVSFTSLFSSLARYSSLLTIGTVTLYFTANPSVGITFSSRYLVHGIFLSIGIVTVGKLLVQHNDVRLGGQHVVSWTFLDARKVLAAMIELRDCS